MIIMMMQDGFALSSANIQQERFYCIISDLHRDQIHQ